MRLVFLLFVMCCSLFSSCGFRVHSKVSQPTNVTGLTQIQKEYVMKYSAKRKKVTDYLKLPESASSEEIRPLAAVFFKLPETVSWQKILDLPLPKMFLTEANRKKCAGNLGLPPTATWIEIGFTAERLRKELGFKRWNLSDTLLSFFYFYKRGARERVLSFTASDDLPKSPHLKKWPTGYWVRSRTIGLIPRRSTPRQDKFLRYLGALPQGLYFDKRAARGRILMRTNSRVLSLPEGLAAGACITFGNW